MVSELRASETNSLSMHKVQNLFLKKSPQSSSSIKKMVGVKKEKEINCFSNLDTDGWKLLATEILLG